MTKNIIHQSIYNQQTTRRRRTRFYNFAWEDWAVFPRWGNGLCYRQICARLRRSL